MWQELDSGFQAAFEMAWEAYLLGTFPIGAAVLDARGQVVARGRNQVYAGGAGMLSHHDFAHAETNVLLELSAHATKSHHPDIGNYVLYTTLEPCPLCFGAIVMSDIRHVRYAARDSYAGATALAGQLEYIRRKGVDIIGPVPGPEAVAVALHVCFFAERQAGRADFDRVLALWEWDSAAGVRAGVRLAESGRLRALHNTGAGAQEIYDHIEAYCG